nr:auxin efflux carrier component 6 [Quercus suber]
MTFSPPFELELSSLNVRSRTLYVCNRTLSTDYGSFMDGLLWSRRPKVISLSTGFEFQEKYIMVLCEKLLCREDPCNCCAFDHKCWRHHLKGGSLAGIEDGRLLDYSQTLADTLPTLPRDSINIPRPSNLSNAEIFSVNTFDGGSGGYHSGASPQYCMSGYAFSDAYSIQPTPPQSNFNNNELDKLERMNANNTNNTNTPVSVWSNRQLGGFFATYLWFSPALKCFGTHHNHQ